MKLIVVASSLDLKQPFAATPAWWQLLKAFYEIGVDLIVTTYQGPAIESPWWRASGNPARLPGDAFDKGRRIARRFVPAATAPETPSNRAAADPLADRLARRVARSTVGPLWHRHLDRLLADNRDASGVLVLTVPMNHLTGIPGALQSKHGVPFFYYDADAPASFPEYAGFKTGFRIYQGADLSEYAAVISNSKGGEKTLERMGARHAHTVHFGADPELFRHVAVEQQDIDALFYGQGREYRSDWIDAMVTIPSREMSDVRFAVRGRDLGDVGRAEKLPFLSLSALHTYVCRSKLNLCVTRQGHASVYATSTLRPFELASMGACIISNPYLGIEEWFAPGKEIVVVESREEAMDRYRWLLDHETERRALAEAAHTRFIAEHTFQHRARDFMRIFQSYR